MEKNDLSPKDKDFMLKCLSYEVLICPVASFQRLMEIIPILSPGLDKTSQSSHGLEDKEATEPRGETEGEVYHGTRWQLFWQVMMFWDNKIRSFS